MKMTVLGRVIVAIGLSMVIAGVLTYMYYDIHKLPDPWWTRFATYPYRQYSASLFFGGFALWATGFGLLWHARVEAETALSSQAKTALIISLVFMFPLFVWIGSFIPFYAEPTDVTDWEQLQTFFTIIVLIPIVFIVVLVVLDRLAHRLADKRENEN